MKNKTLIPLLTFYKFNPQFIRIKKLINFPANPTHSIKILMLHSFDITHEKILRIRLYMLTSMNPHSNT